MKTTGITRHIDELGRIVIPKEIRNNLNIDVNDLLEIYISGSQIILEKTSKLKKINDILDNYLNAFYQILKRNIIVCDKEIIIGSTKNIRNTFLNKKISKELSSILFNNSYKKETLNNPIINDDQSYYYIYKTITFEGNSIGGVVMLSEKNDLSDLDINAILLLTELLTSYLKY